MVLSSVDFLVDALRETNLLRQEQLHQLVEELSPRIEDPQELAKHIVKLGWITLYQAKKLLAGRGSDLILGHYVISDKLGEGGMGKVYKARQLRLSRTVALKVVRPNLIVNEMALKRFQREAKAAAQLAHPNIVRLFDADQVGNRHFLAMEYVEGTDLAKLVHQQGQLPVSMASSFIRQAATGLQHAHDLGIIHRDIKPSNLLVATPNKTGKFDSAGVVKVLDMGLARVARQEDDEASALTQDGTVIGTPEYMSPEQAKNSSTVDARSDLYSLGCSFYYLLTGRTPFPNGTTLEKLMQHQMDPPPKIQSIRSDIPDDVARIVHNLLSKKPAERFESGSALATALDSWSVLDGKNRLLTSSGKINRPAVVPEALFVACTPLPPNIDPFNFDLLETPAPAAAIEQAVAPPPVEPAKKSGPLPLPKKKKSRLMLIAGSLVAVMILAAGILYASGMFDAAAPGDDEGSHTKEEPAANDKTTLPPSKRPDTRTIDYFLPTDTEAVAVLNVQQLSGNRFFQSTMLPKAGEFVAMMKSGAGLDPFKAIEKVIVGIPAGNASQSVVIVHGNDIAGANVLNWVSKLPGATVKAERISGGGSRNIYAIPGDKNEVIHAAVLTTSPDSIVIGTNRERVLEAVVRSTRNTPQTFADSSLKSAIQKYPVKESVTLWIALGNESKLLGLVAAKREKMKETGVNFIVAALRLRDNSTMTFELNIDSKSKNVAEVCHDHVRNLVNLLTTAKPDDQRLARIAELIGKANPTSVNSEVRKESPNIHQWWCSISSDALPTWFAPFLGQ